MVCSMEAELACLVAQGSVDGLRVPPSFVSRVVENEGCHGDRMVH